MSFHFDDGSDLAFFQNVDDLVHGLVEGNVLLQGQESGVGADVQQLLERGTRRKAGMIISLVENARIPHSRAQSYRKTLLGIEILF